VQEAIHVFRLLDLRTVKIFKTGIAGLLQNFCFKVAALELEGGEADIVFRAFPLESLIFTKRDDLERPLVERFQVLFVERPAAVRYPVPFSKSIVSRGLQFPHQLFVLPPK